MASVAAAAYGALVPPASGDVTSWEALFWRWNALRTSLTSDWTRRLVAEHGDARDAAAAAALAAFQADVQPIADRGDARLRAAFLAAPCRPELESRLGAHLFRRWALDQSAYDPANVALAAAEAAPLAAYRKRLGAATLDVAGEPLTFTATQAALADPAPDRRHAAWEALGTWLAGQRTAFHETFDQLLALRHEAATNLSEATFTPVAYRKLGRADYGPAEVAALRAGILEHLVPLAARWRARQAKALGTAAVAGRDMAYDPTTALAALVPVETQLARAGDLFARLDPAIAGHFARMVAGGLIDLADRPGKGVGAFAVSYDDVGQVGIVCQSTGQARDVSVLTHEMGHAVQGWESLAIPAYDVRWPTADVAEVHSLAMELLALPLLDVYFDPDDARRFVVQRLATIVTGLPYIAVVDEFQHWAYAHPGHDHAAREAAWTALYDRYSPGLEMPADAPQRALRWAFQPHIFATPFYYIDYALAELGALQLWQRARTDPAGAMKSYLALCRQGGTRGFADFFASAGMRSPLDPTLLPELAAALAVELDL